MIRILSASVLLASAAIAQVTFHKDIEPILQSHCQNCHRPGEAAPMSLLTYESTRPWAKAIKTAVVSKKMPPWFADPRYGHFQNDPSLKAAEIETLAKWADAGAPEGNPKDAPAAKKWPEGWQIQPDLVVSVPPYTVPAKGLVEWFYITIPGPFKEDTWVTSIEFRPGERSVMHHAVVFFKPHTENTRYNQPIWFNVARDENGIGKPGTGFSNVRRLETDAGDSVSIGEVTGNARLEAVYVPGVQPHDYRKYNAAMLVQGGSDIVIQLHYTPSGKLVTDNTKIGFTLAKEPPKRRFIMYSPQTPQIANREVFRIPAGDPNWKSPPVDGAFNTDAELVWFMPHMHVRGKDMTYSLTHPTGETETVLSVPNYNFEWQLGYEAAKPIKVAKGTRLHVDAHYDNSANNKFNPDPTKDVFSGTQTWEEMMAPFFGVVVDATLDPRKVMTLPGQAGGGGA
jgi:hypothetical protein